MKHAFLAFGLLVTFVCAFSSDAHAVKVLAGQTKTIDEFGGCRKVTNNHSSGLDLFVPTETKNEWQTFVNNPPAGVAVADCWATEGLVLHCNGADGGTTITNNGNGGALTRSGNTMTDTAQKKFGTASCYFDGAGDWLTSTHASNWDLSGDFTFEVWVRPQVVTGTVGVMDQATGHGWGWNGFYIEFNSSSYRLGVDGSYSSGSAISTGAWTHLAVSRNGSNLRIFKNGALVQNMSNSTSWQGALTIGTYVDQQNSSSYNYKGWMDEIRLIKGTGAGIYTAAFTPSTDEYW